MKKQIIMLGIVVMLICVGLSGCEELTTNLNSESKDLVEFTNYKVTTEWYQGNYMAREYVIKEGFYHDFPGGETVYYYISGNVKNIADKPIDRVTIVANFFDSEDNFLDSSETKVLNLYLNESKNFKITAKNIDLIGILLRVRRTLRKRLKEATR